MARRRDFLDLADPPQTGWWPDWHDYFYWAPGPGSGGRWMHDPDCDVCRRKAEAVRTSYYTTCPASVPERLVVKTEGN